MQPSFFIPHGGGPCFFMEWDPPETWNGMRAFLEGLITGLPRPPRAVLVVTAHWEEPEITLSTKEDPGLYYDYYNFPPHTYRLEWPARGSPEIAARAAGLLREAGIAARLDDRRDYDHGVFIPMMLAMPAPEAPVVQMSIRADLDPAHHLAAGHALAPLRREGVVIIGSGMSYHNLRAFMSGGDTGPSEAFDAWLTAVVEGDPARREAALADWAAAPGARAAHPREEHLAPIWVAAGAASGEPAQRVYGEKVMGAAISAYRFGAAGTPQKSD